MPRTKKPSWDDGVAQSFIGRRIIVGLTKLDAVGVLVDQRQFHGTVEATDAKRGVGIRVAGDDELHWLPPDLSAIQIAPPGEYRMRSTGEVVVNPDLMSIWTVSAPQLH